MKLDKVEKLEKLINKISASYKELSVLSKKSPNDSVNTFKLKIINNILVECNSFLENDNLPIAGFLNFEEDIVPTNSDVVFVLMQYLEALEKIRSDNIILYGGRWFYDIEDVPDEKGKVFTYAPIKTNKKEL